MPSSAVIEGYATAIDGLCTLATRDVKDVLDSLAGENPIAFRDALVEALPDILDPYGNAAGEVAAEWYMELRADAGVLEIFDATALLAPDRERSEVLARWSVAPLFDQSDSTVLSLLSGGLQRMISNVGRDTISDNALRDPVRTGYARFPRTGCCAFCAMLASRGAVYGSEASAGGVQGRGVSAASTAGKVGGQGKGTKTRGSQAVGKDFHDHCHCTVAPVFTGDSRAKDTREQYEAIYAAAHYEADGRTAKAVLSEMRKQQGIR